MQFYYKIENNQEVHYTVINYGFSDKHYDVLRTFLIGTITILTANRLHLIYLKRFSYYKKLTVEAETRLLLKHDCIFYIVVKKKICLVIMVRRYIIYDSSHYS